MVDVSKCKAKEPATCPYHGAALRMVEAVSKNDLNSYISAREDFDAAVKKNKRTLLKTPEDYIPMPQFNPHTETISDDVLNMKDQTIVVDEHTSLIVQNHRYNGMWERKTFTVWMQVDGKNIGMVRYLIGGDKFDYPAVGDIEIRESHRGQKLGIKLINLIETKVIHTKLYTSGGFTPEGYKAFAGIVPIYPYMHDKPLKVEYSSMNFVHDWEKLQLDSY